MRDNLLPVVLRGKSFNAEFAFILAALIFIGPAKSAEIPKPSAKDSRIGELSYDPNQIFQIQVAKGVATHIVLAPDEKIVVSAPGIAADCRQDSAEWCVVANIGTNELFVQPRTISATSNNLELATNLRRYSFDFVQSASRAQTPWYRVSFRYPADVSDPSGMGDGRGKRCNWNYSMQRSWDTGGLAPLAVFDDGRNTYLMLPVGGVVPELIGDAGRADRLQRIPGIPDDRMLAVAGVHDKFVIRSGLASITIWNEGSVATAPSGACPAW